MDINNVVLSGRLFDIGVNESRTGYPVVEARLSCNVGVNKDGEEMFDEFKVRSYGKKSVFISTLKEGTYVVIEAIAKEDIRVNADNPNTTRSETYFNIQKIKTVGMTKGDMND